jgi:hypothetical protein
MRNGSPPRETIHRHLSTLIEPGIGSTAGSPGPQPAHRTAARAA